MVDTEERDLPPKDALAATIPEAAACFWMNHWPVTMQTKKTKKAESAPTLIVVAVLALCMYMTNLAICLVLCQHVALVVGSNGDRSWGTCDIRWDGRIVIVAQVRTHGRFALLLTQANKPPLVASKLRTLFAKRLVVLESSSLSRMKSMVKMRPRRPAQRKGTRLGREQARHDRYQQEWE